MKQLLVSLIALAAAVVQADEIKLPDGTVFKNAKITSSDAASVTITHDAGVARVMIPQLPPDLRAKYKYDAERAAAVIPSQQAHPKLTPAAAKTTAAVEQPKTSSSIEDEVRKEMHTRIAKLKEDGMLRLDPGVADAKAWVNPVVWIACDAEVKESFTKALAMYCHPDYPSISIFDLQSGRELASYGPFQGFKVQ